LRKLPYIILLASILLLTGTECHSAGGEARLENGLRAYKEEADFNRAISELQEAVRLGLSDGDNLIQAHLYLGFAYIGSGKTSAAEIEFAKAIKLDPTLELDSKRHSTKVINVFNGMRDRLVDSLTIISAPGEAKVYLDVLGDGSELVRVGSTPLTLNNVLMGDHTVRIVKIYFQPKVLKIRVEKGEDNRVQVQLDKAAIELRITSQPPETVVHVADKGVFQTQPYGTTPVSLEAFLDQELAIRLAKEEFRNKELTIKLTETGVMVLGMENVIPLENGVATVDVALAPAPPPGSLRVISDPPGAMVRLDGIEVGDTPLTIAKATPGSRRLRISLSGFASVTKKVEIVSSQEMTVQVVLGGLLNISSIPDDAQVFLDGKYIGLTPFRTGRVPAGSHQLRLTRNKYKDRTSAVIVEKGLEKEVTIRLIPAKGSIAVSSDPPGASVYLNGEIKGNAPLFIYGVIVGQHSLRLTKSGYEDQEKQITVEELKVSWQFGKLKSH